MKKPVRAAHVGLAMIAMTAGLGLCTSSTAFGGHPLIDTKWNVTFTNPGGSSFQVRFLNNNYCEFKEDENDTNPKYGTWMPVTVGDKTSGEKTILRFSAASPWCGRFAYVTTLDNINATTFAGYQARMIDGKEHFTRTFSAEKLR